MTPAAVDDDDHQDTAQLIHLTCCQPAGDCTWRRLQRVLEFVIGLSVVIVVTCTLSSPHSAGHEPQLHVGTNAWCNLSKTSAPPQQHQTLQHATKHAKPSALTRFKGTHRGAGFGERESKRVPTAKRRNTLKPNSTAFWNSHTSKSNPPAAPMGNDWC